MSARLRYTSFLAFVILSALVVSACSTPPKPGELLELEALRKKPYTKQIQKNEEARAFLSSSEEHYTLALEFYEDEELQRVKNQAIMGSMKYRTAESIARKVDAVDRMSVANEKYLRSQKIRNDQNSRRELLEKSVSALTREKGLLQEKIAGINAAVTQKALDDREKALVALKTQTADEISKAELSQKESEKFGASKNAAGSYNQGNNKLNSARKLLTLEKYEQASEMARSAVMDFDKARLEARPIWEKEQDKLRRLEVNKQLLDEAQRIFPGSVKEEGRGVVVRIPALFKPRKAKVDENQLYHLESILTLARKYPDYKVLIEGHTDSRGNSNRNLTLSQNRANVVRDYFIERNFEVGRLLTVGKGGDYPVFTSRRERKKNHRVDVVFLYSR